jgi:hypothetical protein
LAPGLRQKAGGGNFRRPARLAKVEFTVQILYNSKRKPTHVFAGDVVQAHHAACPGNKTCGQMKIFKNEMRLNIGSPHRCGFPRIGWPAIPASAGVPV